MWYLFVSIPQAKCGALGVGFIRGMTTRVNPTTQLNSIADHIFARTFTRGRWYHIAMTVDERVAEMSLFVNGGQVARASLTGGGLPEPPSYLHGFGVGSFYFNHPRFRGLYPWKGGVSKPPFVVDEFMMFPVALSRQHIIEAALSRENSIVSTIRPGYSNVGGRYVISLPCWCSVPPVSLSSIVRLCVL